MLPLKNLPANPERRIVPSGIAHLSPDKEIGPFLFYLLGDDLDAVSFKTGYPKDTLMATSARYGWEERRVTVMKDQQSGALIKDLEQSLLNNILVATYAVAMRQAGDVIAGRVDASKCGLIPSSMQGLQRLLEMIESANGLVAGNQEPPAQTVVHAENVQINQGLPAPVKAPFEEKRKSILQMLADKAKASMEKK